MTKDQMLSLPRKYESKWANFNEREVAIYIDGDYATRGPASHARLTCHYGFRAYDVIHPSRITWQLDTWHGRRGDDDVENLCWESDVRLTCEEMLEWLNNNPLT